ncbi:MAG TPA: glycosyltransferase [Mycobacteriales bacterium]
MSDQDAELSRLRGGLWAVTQRAETLETERAEAVKRAESLAEKVRELEKKASAQQAELARLRANPLVRLGAPVRALRRRAAGARGPAGRTGAAAHTWRSRSAAPGVPRIVGVLDGMSVAGFGPDCELLLPGTTGWQADVEAFEPDMLLVESAWRGNDDAWRYCVGTYTAEEYRGLPQLRALVEWFRARGLPTVFWNKEDPVHFEKFAEAARLFDIVFTSDENSIERYRAQGGAASFVGALQFAAQPRLHHPFGPARRDPSPVFAGTFYRNRHEDRQGTLAMLLSAAKPFDLRIYDRAHGDTSGHFGFPDDVADRVLGSLPYTELVDVYRRHRVFLNTNSVTASPTMFSRRVFELLACGTAVVSTPSDGLARQFGGIVDIVETPEEATAALQALLGSDGVWRQRHAEGIRSVMTQHTYAHRLAQICDAAGVARPALPSDYALVVTDAAPFDAAGAGAMTDLTVPPKQVFVADDPSWPGAGVAAHLARAYPAAQVAVVAANGVGAERTPRFLAEIRDRITTPWLVPAGAVRSGAEVTSAIAYAGYADEHVQGVVPSAEPVTAETPPTGPAAAEDLLAVRTEVAGRWDARSHRALRSWAGPMQRGA